MQRVIVLNYGINGSPMLGLNLLSKLVYKREKGVFQKLKGNSFCETCKLNKQRGTSFKLIRYSESKHPLELLHLYVWEPNKVKRQK